MAILTTEIKVMQLEEFKELLSSLLDNYHDLPDSAKLALDKFKLDMETSNNG